MKCPWIRVLALAVVAQSIYGQPTPQTPLLITRITGITSSATIIDNRSTAIRRMSLHTFCAVGSGSWTAAMQYQDGGILGAWTTFPEASATVTNSSGNCIGGAYGYHDYLRFSVTGSVTVEYSGTRFFFPQVNFAGASGAPTGATYITQTCDATLTAEQCLSALGTGILKGTTGTGAVSIAVGADLPSHVHSGADITSGLVALARGGSNADLSATGGANQFLKQSSIGAAFTAGTIADADVPDTITASNYQSLSGKDAASGYAGLTAGTKLNIAQGQEVWALTDLSDVSAKKGNSTIVQMQTGATSTDDCAKFDVNGNIVSAGAACGSGGGLGDPGGNGVVVRTALNTTTFRTITGTANEIGVTNGDGVSGNPTLALPATVSLASKIFRVPNSTALPGTCTVGDVYMDTDATTGQRWYLCEVTNTWVVQGGGGAGAPGGADNATQYRINSSTFGGIINTTARPQFLGNTSSGVPAYQVVFPSQLGCDVVWTSTTRLTVFTGASATQPCTVVVGDTPYSFTASETITLSGAETGIGRIGVSTAGTLTIWHNITDGNVAITGVLAKVPATTAFPAGSARLYTWGISAGNWDASASGLHRPFMTTSLIPVAGIGLTSSDSGGIRTLNVDPATYPALTGVWDARGGIQTWPWRDESSDPGTCTAGEAIFNTTAAQVKTCLVTNVWTAFSTASPAFSAITSATNTTAAMVLGTGASLTVSGSGTNTATSINVITTEGDLLYRDGSGNQRLARGTNGQCLTANTTTIVWGSCGGGASAWSAITNPTGVLALTMDATETTALTMTGNTGAADMFSILDATGNTGTGHLFEVHSVGTSTMKPVRFTAGGTTNGVEIDASGFLAAIGSGRITGTHLALAANPANCAANNFALGIDAAGVAECAQPTMLNLATFTSANLATQLTDETGTGLSVFGTQGSLIRPLLVSTAFASLPAAGTADRTAVVTDCLTAACTAGGGIIVRLLRDTGAAWALLGDGDSGGGVTGSSTATYMTYWDSGSNVTGSINNVWDNTNARQIIGGTTGLYLVGSATAITTQASVRSAPGSGNLVLSGGIVYTCLDVTGCEVYNSTNSFFGGTTNPISPVSVAIAASTTIPRISLGNSAIASGDADGTFVGGNQATNVADWINLQIAGADAFRVNGAGVVTAATWQGVAVALGYGGTGATTSQGAIDAISQLTTEGDLLFRNATVSTRLARGANGECLTSSTTTILWGSCGGGGDNISVNGTAATNADFDDATPAAPANGINVKWQKDAGAPDNISAHLLTTTVGAVTWLDNTDRAWTFDIAAAGTNPVISFSSNTVNVSTGVLQQGGTAVVLTTRALTGGAGIAALGDLSADRTIATASGEADFLASGALACGTATQGKAQVHTTPLQYCDNAATPTLQYAAYGNSTGEATSIANSAVVLTTDVTGVLPAANMGVILLANTALTTRGDLMVANTATPVLARLAKGTQYQSLQGGASDLLWDALHLDQATAITGIGPVANGFTGLSSGTSGGILGYTAAGTLASSVALTVNAVVIGGGAGATPTPSTLTATVTKMTSGVPSAATVGTDYGTPDATAKTYTNTTYDAEGTGNVFSIPAKYAWSAGGCNNATAGPALDIPTSGGMVAACLGTGARFGVLESADGSTTAAYAHVKLTGDFTTTGGVDIVLIYTGDTSSTNDIRHQVSSGCVADSEDLISPSFNTASASNNAGPATAGLRKSVTFTGVVVTNCAAGETMFLKVERIGADAGDTYAGISRLLEMEVTLRRLI